MASLSLAATLAGGFAITGCGGDNGTTTQMDGGDGGGMDAPAKIDVTPPPVDAPADVPADKTAMDSPPPPVDAPIDTGPVPMPCAAPTFSPAAGVVTLGSNVTISGPMGATIYYTIDKTMPFHGATGSSAIYSGPIQIAMAETINAIAFQQGVCTDSPVASASYTTAMGDGGLTPPLFTPPATTENNDFLVSLSDGASGATICFTTDGVTTPACTITATSATCTSTSTTYNAGAGLNAMGSVSITSAITNATTGNVTIKAVACIPGSMESGVSMQQYTLQVANPTMQNPPAAGSTFPVNLPFVAGGYNPTVSSATTGAQLFATTNGTAAGCTNSTGGASGTLLIGANMNTSNPATIGQNGNAGLTQNTTFSIVACKTGYAAATAGTFGYTITLPTPTVNTAAGTYNSTFNVGLTDTPATGANAPGLFYCWSATGNAACSDAGSACTTGTMSATAAITANGTLTAVACSPNYNHSAMASAAYNLQLSPPAVYSPGCSSAGTTGTCLPLGVTASVPATSYTLITTGNGFTAGPGIQQSSGAAANIPTTPTAAQAGYAFVCAANGTTTAPPATPACAASTCTTGTAINPTGGGFTAGNGQSLTGGTGLPVPIAGDVWNFIACPGAVSPAFAASAMTTISFNAPGTPNPPTISPGTETASNSLGATLSNVDTNALALCWSTTATAPSCASATPGTLAAGCCKGGTAVKASGNATVTALNLSTGGSGYSSTPTVSIAGPPSGTGATATATVGYAIASVTVTSGNSCNAGPFTVGFAGGGGSGAAATATITGADNHISAITVTNGGSGYTSAPTVSVAGCSSVGATAVLATTGSVASLTLNNHGSGYTTPPAVTISGGGGSGATATAVLDDSCSPAALAALNTNTTTLKAISCNGTLGSSTPTQATYSFQDSQPTITGPGNANLTGGGTVNVGVQVTVASPTTAGSDPGIYLCVNTNAGQMANCTCTPATGVTRTANGTNNLVVGPINGTTSISAIACDSAGANAWTASTVTNATINTQLPTPTFDVGGGTYQNVQTVHVANFAAFPGGTAFCYTTAMGATPACTAGACTGGSQTYNNGAGITVNQTGTVLNLVACTASASAPATGPNTYTLNVTPGVVTNGNTTLTCNGNVVIGLDCSVGGGVCSSQTTNQGGPTNSGATPAVTVCYSSTSSVNSCAGGAGITCFTATNGATHTDTSFSSNATLSLYSCVTTGGVVFNSTSSSATVTMPAAFSITPVIDGNLADWNGSTNVPDCAVPGALPATCAALAGMRNGFSGFDTNNLYFAYSGESGINAPATTTNITIYVGDGAASAVNKPLIPTEACPSSTTLPTAMDALYAFSFVTSSGAVTAYQWNSGGAAWMAITTPAGLQAVGAGANIELLIPKAAVGNIATPSILGALVLNHGNATCGGANPATTTDTFPQVMGTTGLYAHYLQENVNSCLAPNTAANIH